MKSLQILILSLFIAGCANAQPNTVFSKLNIEGNALPAIQHIIDMKMSGDTLLFVYECKNGYGQQYLRRAIVDSTGNKLCISSDMGKREDGYYVTDTPYPFIATDRAIHVISSNFGDIYTIENDTAFVRTKRYLMSGKSTLPFPITQYFKDVFMTAPDKYVFVGRQPKGGNQYAMTADLTAAKVDTIKQICITQKLQAWMPNVGEMAYSNKHHRLAFAYRLHPAIEIFGLDGVVHKKAEVAKPTFDAATLEEADFEDLNPLHFIDIIATDDYIYALHWGYKYSQRHSSDLNSSIYKIDWDGNIVNQYTVSTNLQNIAVYNNHTLIGWTGSEFIIIMY